MKIYLIDTGEKYSVCANNEKEAKEHFLESEGYEETDIESIKEIPPGEWDKYTIVYTDVPDEETGKAVEITYREFMKGQTSVEVFCSTEWIN